MMAAAGAARPANGCRRMKQRLFQVLGFARVRGAARPVVGTRVVAPHGVLYKLHGGVAVFTRHPDSRRIAMPRAKKRTLIVLAETAFFMRRSRERSVIQQSLHRRQHGSVHVDGGVRAG